MKTIKIKKTQIRKCVNSMGITKKQNGDFIPFEFVSYCFEENKFLWGRRASSNCTYQGIMVWNNGCELTSGTAEDLVDYIFNSVLECIHTSGHPKTWDCKFEVYASK